MDILGDSWTYDPGSRGEVSMGDRDLGVIGRMTGFRGMDWMKSCKASM